MRSADEEKALQAKMKSVARRIDFKRLVIFSALFYWGGGVINFNCCTPFSNADKDSVGADSEVESGSTVYLEDLEKDAPL